MKKPILLSYSTQRSHAIHIERSVEHVSAAETGRLGTSFGTLFLIGCALAMLLLMGPPFLRRPGGGVQVLDAGAVVAATCLMCAVICFVWRLTRKSPKPIAYLEITRSSVLIRKANASRDISFPTEELAGVICSRVERDRVDLEVQHGAACLKLLRVDGTSDSLFAGHTEKLLEEVEFECRMFLSSIRPSPMADAIVPPRPRH